ncbi:glycosyltransferase family 2 protein [Dechloromonas hortensis]|uniref:glycosyltransferase family 2 protein n=1 Tax=Dechloromonas hortensis TaxID=337779 RepID=UPI00129290E9|nr:glycosyltransferase [Dechloromonas hortensis]
MSFHDIDVVVPVFNGEKYIAKALQSVQQQTVPVARIIIADDGSTDGTAQIIENFRQSDDRVLYLKLTHAGVSATRNQGIRASTAAYVAFLDADDIWLPEKLERQLDAFERGGAETGFVHSSYFCINTQGECLPDQKVVPPKQRGDIFMPLLLDGYVLSGSASSVLVRRTVLDKVGYFDERLFYGEDWDLWLRLAQVSKVDFTSEAVVGIRVHDGSAQRRARPGRALQFFQQQLLVYSKWEALISGDKRFKARLRKQAVDAVLPVLTHPAEALSFYWNLATSESVLVRSIVRNALTFWLEVCIRVLRIVWWHAKSKAGLNGE